jgi:hypothetical protein
MGVYAQAPCPTITSLKITSVTEWADLGNSNDDNMLVIRPFFRITCPAGARLRHNSLKPSAPLRYNLRYICSTTHGPFLTTCSRQRTPLEERSLTSLESKLSSEHATCEHALLQYSAQCKASPIGILAKRDAVHYTGKACVDFPPPPLSTPHVFVISFDPDQLSLLLYVPILNMACGGGYFTIDWAFQVTPGAC